MKNSILFLPLLLIYCIIVFRYPAKHAIDDENRYIQYAENITHGHYLNEDNVQI